ncbi:MAG: hypothetical protein A2201_10740 [Alicyclobacillus sp. RIFOXYA1_FULL_53_8]|nr:MAG: hypothetical protein A2201_10740 [Alicyclobacillus sp. RIFOXYA1_FULL_53_8]
MAVQKMSSYDALQGRFEDSSFAFFTIFSAILRPLWQLSILVLYAIVLQGNGFRAIDSVGAAAFIASNFILIGKPDHPDWPKVQRITVQAEAGIATILALLFLPLIPEGPASLLLLPSTVTYVMRFARGKMQYILMAVTLFVYFLTVILHLTHPSRNFTFSADSWKQWTLLIAYGAVLVFGLVIGELLQRQRLERQSFQVTHERLQTQSQQLERINNQLNEYANRVYDLAALEERNRIAGEIHDTVAHRLTALFVQLQAARRILRQGDTATAEGNLIVCEELARESLEEVRSSVRAIRRSSGDEGVHALRRLVLHYASLTGMDIHFAADPTVAVLPSPLMATLYRAIQEGLTNAQRHGRATEVWVTLKRTGVYLALDIEDNGRGQVTPHMGFGLSSMRDRMRQYGGEVTVQSQPAQGFLLRLEIPLWEER